MENAGKIVNIVLKAVAVGMSVTSIVLAIYPFSWDSKYKKQRSHPLLGALGLLPFFVFIFLL